MKESRFNITGVGLKYIFFNFAPSFYFSFFFFSPFLFCFFAYTDLFFFFSVSELICGPLLDKSDTVIIINDLKFHFEYFSCITYHYTSFRNIDVQNFPFWMYLWMVGSVFLLSKFFKVRVSFSRNPYWKATLQNILENKINELQN